MKHHNNREIWTALLGGMTLAAALLLPSAARMPDPGDSGVVRSLSQDVDDAAARMNDDICAEIFSLPRVRSLPWTNAAAPQPDPAAYTADGYRDDSLTVKCWQETIRISDKKSVQVNFADVTVAHPSQLRTAFAGGSYDSPKREFPSVIAAAQHAVVATNADYYSYRAEGIVLRQNVLYRQKAYGIDTLLIDDHGDFTVMTDTDVIREKRLEKDRIRQVLSFGPVLVQNGKAVHRGANEKCVVCGSYVDNPRTAIGQLGTLRYLMCTVDGRSEQSSGCTTNELADIMAQKGCVTAYNLDGGQSSSMVFHDRLYNHVSNGGERRVSDIVYFATAVPEEEWKQGGTP